jgi:hypothetical protein
MTALFSKPKYPKAGPAPVVPRRSDADIQRLTEEQRQRAYGAEASDTSTFFGSGLGDSSFAAKLFGGVGGKA